MQKNTTKNPKKTQKMQKNTSKQLFKTPQTPLHKPNLSAHFRPKQKIDAKNYVGKTAFCCLNILFITTIFKKIWVFIKKRKQN